MNVTSLQHCNDDSSESSHCTSGYDLPTIYP